MPRKLLLVAAILLAISWGGLQAASAGNLLVTGHDTDFHSEFGGNAVGSQHLFNAFTTFAMDGSVLPYLLVDHVGGEAVVAATSFGKPFVLADPSSVGFDALLSTLSTGAFSALVVASANSCGGCDLTLADLTRLGTHTAGIQAFFDAGGGIFLNTGGTSPAEQAAMYSFIPTITATGAISSITGFSLTADGTALFPGLTNADFNGNATHNQFLGFSNVFKVVETNPTVGGTGDITLACEHCTIGTIVAGVPEPSAFVLLGSALVGLVGMRRLRGRFTV